MRINVPVIRTSLWLNSLLTLLLLVSCGKNQYTVFYGGPILTMDQEFQSQQNLCVIIRRIAENQYIPSMQPIHATSDMKWVVSRLGAKRAETTYAWRSLIEAGSIIAGGSDAPVEPINPFWGLYAAETRQDHFGHPAIGFIPQERVTRSQALQMYTTWGAFAAFKENEIGSLKKGYQADLVILDRDISRVPVKDLLKTRVLRTYVRGEQVFGTADLIPADN